MKLTLPFDAGRLLTLVGLTTRLLLGVIIDTPRLYNAGWISILIGVVLCIPLAFLADRFMHVSGARPIASALEESAGIGPTRTVCALMALIMLYECAVVSRALINSASYVAVENTNALVLLLPLMLTSGAACLCNGMAIGGAGRIWIKLTVVLMVLVFVTQLSSFRVQWLTPIFGPGARVLFDGARSAAGWLTPIVAFWLCSEPNENCCKKRSPLLMTLLYIGLAALVFALLFTMMSPASIRGNLSRVALLDKLLSNGRASLSLQLPLVILWYNGLLFSVTGTLFVTAKLIQIAIPKLDGRLSIALCAAAVIGLASSGVAEQEPAVKVGNWMFFGIAILFLILMFLPVIRKGGKPRCAQSK